MKTFAEILAREEKNDEVIFLYLKNDFWVAYEVSAYLLQKHFWPELKVRVKNDFASKKVYVTVGFIQTSWCKVEEKLKSKNLINRAKLETDEIQIFGVRKDETFQRWRDEFLSVEKKLQQQMRPFYGMLPIYKRSYDLMSLVVSTARKFSQELRDLIGKPLMNEMMTINRLWKICAQNQISNAEKVCYLEDIESAFGEMMFLLRLAIDQKACGIERSVTIMEETQEILQQIKMWKKKLKTTSVEEK